MLLLNSVGGKELVIYFCPKGFLSLQMPPDLKVSLLKLEHKLFHIIEMSFERIGVDSHQTIKLGNTRILTCISPCELCVAACSGSVSEGDPHKEPCFMQFSVLGC